jgi:hypothetical protein
VWQLDIHTHNADYSLSAGRYWPVVEARRLSIRRPAVSRRRGLASQRTSSLRSGRSTLTCGSSPGQIGSSRGKGWSWRGGALAGVVVWDQVREWRCLIPPHPGRPAEPEPPQQVHPIGLLRGRGPPGRLQISQVNLDMPDDLTRRIDQPIRIPRTTRGLKETRRRHDEACHIPMKII